MANVKFPRKEFESTLGSKISPEIEEKIHLFGTPLESLSDEEIEIEIFPNRPDLLSFHNYLRAFKAFLGKSPGLKKYKLLPPKDNYKVTISPSVKSVRPFTACAIIKNLSLNDEKIKEIIGIQEKLHSTLGRNRKKLAIGIYPLEKIKLPITYEARLPEKIKFTPLESPKEMTGHQILQSHPTGREYAHLLSDVSKYPVFVDANNNILSMPPIINSNETGKITNESKDIFIECSGFHLDTLKTTLNILITTFAEMTPSSSIYQMKLQYDKPIITPSLVPQKMKVSPPVINKLIGIDFTESQLEKLLPKMEFEYSKGIVSIPPWRTDILHQHDIAEDTAIAYGFENLKPIIPNISTSGAEHPKSKFKSKLSEILTGLDMLEISSFHLIKPTEAKLMKLKPEQIITLEDSKSEYKILRPNLLIPTLRILSENKDSDYPQNIFEIGTTFDKSSDTEKQIETGIKETQSLIISKCPANFTEMKQVLDYFTKQLNIQYELEESSHPQLIEGRTAKILINNKEVGHLGELHPKTLRAWQIKMPVAVIEIELDDIYKLLRI